MYLEKRRPEHNEYVYDLRGLTLEEVSVLSELTGSVTGDQEGPRGVTDRIWNALQQLGGSNSPLVPGHYRVAFEAGPGPGPGSFSIRWLNRYSKHEWDKKQLALLQSRLDQANAKIAELEATAAQEVERNVDLNALRDRPFGHL